MKILITRRRGIYQIYFGHYSDVVGNGHAESYLVIGQAPSG